MPRPPLSPRAVSLQRHGTILWGVLLLGVWLLGTAFWTVLGASGFFDSGGADEPVPPATAAVAYFIASQLLVGLFGVLGLVLVVVGLRAGRRARAFEQRDRALAAALAGAVDQLRRLPAEAVYEPGEGDVVLRGARLVEVSRHFDSQAHGAVTGTMVHRMRSFGSSFSLSYGASSGLGVGSSSFSSSAVGLSSVDLQLSATTRDDLMGDALFAVFEAPGPAGPEDVHRVVSMSAAAAMGWVSDLVASVAYQLGGRDTHAGATLLAAAGELAARFAPPDVSYTTDRLMALERRSAAERAPVTVHGPAIGRNALLGAGISIDGGTPLQLLPAGFPQLFGQVVGQALAAAEQQLPGGSRRAVTA
ncbi:hypothetical protein GC722_04775 [Auraticoccus sp. F435]|uniref:Uncharacterized protein n=1 Tax=Auraticoccus cholistanensis TaxID=2656650 RepID=A0A6A9UUD0_9ACTN|nr:hypothetical protein [Auraticoccus cholistanensis]MVA75345.1 hypothetical protein [Auraticoccus cholistanensis]